VALRGWRETSETDCYTFCERLQVAGVRTIICTDISKDGAMRGTNRELYRELSRKFNMNIIASGGVSTLDDVVALSRLGIYGAIIGRALYTGDINLKEALEAAI
jgi:phosphoribosylformimino-5-aminoimidazole carboxamide ribotide isomerase